MKTQRKNIVGFVALTAALWLPLTAHCFYNPSTGRWLSRDPIGEQGGLNLYAFVQNSPVDFFDCFGLYHAQQHRELTTAALNAESQNLATTAKCLETIRKRLIRANLSQDSVWGNL